MVIAYLDTGKANDQSEIRMTYDENNALSISHFLQRLPKASYLV